MFLLKYRVGTMSDIPSMARIRSGEWGTEEYWSTRIAGYMNGTHHPKQAMPTRIVYVSMDSDTMAGFIAGHLTERLGCAGELEWINVAPQYRRKGVASTLLYQMASWFDTHHATRVCVDVAEDNVPALRFYEVHGAKNLNPHWLFWDDIRIVQKGRSRI